MSISLHHQPDNKQSNKIDFGKYDLATANKHIEKNVVLQTEQQQWVIPNSCVMLKLLLKQQSIAAGDLKFSCHKQCQCLIKNLLLLALRDEYKSLKPSPIAEFARELIKHKQTNIKA